MQEQVRYSICSAHSLLLLDRDLVLVNSDKSLNTYPIPQSDKLPFGSGEKVHFLLEELYQDLSSFEKTFPSELH